MDTCSFLCICFKDQISDFCTVFFCLYKYIYIYIYVCVYIYLFNILKVYFKSKMFFFNLIAFLSYLKTNKMNKWTYICKSCVFVVSRSADAGGRPPAVHTHVRTHTCTHTHTHLGNTPACNSARCINPSKTTSCWWRPPPPPFCLKGLWSRCIALNRPITGEEGVGGAWRTHLQVLCLWPTQQQTRWQS